MKFACGTEQFFDQKDSDYDTLLKKGTKVVDHTFGHVTLIKDPTIHGDKIMCKTTTVDNERSVKEFINKTQKRLGLQHKNLTNMCDFSYHIKNEWCSRHFILNLYYSYFEHSIYKELSKRRSQKKDFVDEEISILQYEQIGVLAYQQSADISHGDLRPETIFLDTNQKIIISKLCDRISNESSVQAQMHHLLDGDDIYIAPEVFINLNLGQTNFSYNHFKADAYSLGLIFLEMGLIRSINSIYNKRENKIKEETIEDMLQLFNHKFPASVWISDAIRCLLQKDPNRRLDFIQQQQCLPNKQMVDDYYNQLRVMEKMGNQDYSNLNHPELDYSGIGDNLRPSTYHFLSSNRNNKNEQDLNAKFVTSTLHTPENQVYSEKHNSEKPKIFDGFQSTKNFNQEISVRGAKPKSILKKENSRSSSPKKNPINFNLDNHSFITQNDHEEKSFAENTNQDIRGLQPSYIGSFSNKSNFENPINFSNNNFTPKRNQFRYDQKFNPNARFGEEVMVSSVPQEQQFIDRKIGNSNPMDLDADPDERYFDRMGHDNDDYYIIGEKDLYLQNKQQYNPGLPNDNNKQNNNQGYNNHINQNGRLSSRSNNGYNDNQNRNDQNSFDNSLLKDRRNPTSSSNKNSKAQFSDYEDPEYNHRNEGYKERPYNPNENHRNVSNHSDNKRNQDYKNDTVDYQIYDRKKQLLEILQRKNDYLHPDINYDRRQVELDLINNLIQQELDNERPKSSKPVHNNYSNKNFDEQEYQNLPPTSKKMGSGTNYDKYSTPERNKKSPQKNNSQQKEKNFVDVNIKIPDEFMQKFDSKKHKLVPEITVTQNPSGPEKPLLLVSESSNKGKSPNNYIIQPNTYNPNNRSNHSRQSSQQKTSPEHNPHHTSNQLNKNNYKNNKNNNIYNHHQNIQAPQNNQTPVNNSRIIFNQNNDQNYTNNSQGKHNENPKTNNQNCNYSNINGYQVNPHLDYPKGNKINQHYNHPNTKGHQTNQDYLNTINQNHRNFHCHESDSDNFIRLAGVLHKKVTKTNEILDEDGLPRTRIHISYVPVNDINNEAPVRDNSNQNHSKQNNNVKINSLLNYKEGTGSCQIIDEESQNYLRPVLNNMKVNDPSGYQEITDSYQRIDEGSQNYAKPVLRSEYLEM